MPASAKKIRQGKKTEKKRRRGFKCEWGRRRNRKKTTFSNRQNHRIFRPPLTIPVGSVGLADFADEGAHQTVLAYPGIPLGALNLAWFGRAPLPGRGVCPQRPCPTVETSTAKPIFPTQSDGTPSFKRNCERCGLGALEGIGTGAFIVEFRSTAKAPEI